MVKSKIAPRLGTKRKFAPLKNEPVKIPLSRKSFVNPLTGNIVKRPTYLKAIREIKRREEAFNQLEARLERMEREILREVSGSQKLEAGDPSGLNDMIRYDICLSDRDFRNLMQIMRANNYRRFKIVYDNGDVIYRNFKARDADMWRIFFDNLCQPEGAQETGSDGLDDVDIRRVVSMTPEIIPFVRRARRQAGRFFEYENLTDKDLTRYQIYRSTDLINNEHCLLYSLRLNGVTNDKITALKSCYDFESSFDKKALHKVADIIKSRIVLRDAQQDRTELTYGEQYNDIVNLALFENHYFIWEPIEGKYNSLYLVRTLHKKKQFRPYNDDDINKMIAHKSEITIPLSNIENEQIEYEYTPKPSYKDERKLIFALDDETYRFWYDDEYEDPITDTLDDAMERLLDYGTASRDSFIIYVPDLKRFWHQNKDFLFKISTTVDNGVYYAVNVIYNKCNVQFRNLKTILPMTIDEALNMYNIEKSTEQIKNIQNIIKKHRQSVKRIFNQDIYDHLTVSSYTDAYFKDNHSHNGFKEISGNLREFCSQAVYGGKTYINPDYKKKIITESVSSLDANSAYVGAITRICDEYGGFPTDKAKIINDFSEDLPYFIAEIRITKINKRLQIPLIAIKSSNEKEEIKYINDLPNDKPLVVTVDKITLEDYVLHHGIEYEFIRGVYWNMKNPNSNFGAIMKNLYTERREAKTSGNLSKSELLKLSLVSPYGKLITKKRNTKTIIMKETEYPKYNAVHFDTICEKNGSKKIGYGQIEVNRRCIDTSGNFGHIGAMVLSMSKRIMNEVCDIAESLNIPIYYHAIDSIHLPSKDIKNIEKEYKGTYGHHLIGQSLGQFKNENDEETSMSVYLKNGWYIESMKSNDRYRCSGIPKTVIDNTANRYGMSIKEFYQYLSTTEDEVTFYHENQIYAKIQF